MRNFLKRIHNPYFNIGVYSVFLVLVIANFMSGDFSLNKTLIYGTMVILAIGLNLMDIEKLKKEDNQ